MDEVIGRGPARPLGRPIFARAAQRGWRSEERAALLPRSPLLGWLVDRNITPYIPVIDRGRQRDAFFTRDAFRYDREADAYRCPADKLLGYCGTNRASQVRVYRSRPADCTACDLKPQCTIGKKRGVTRLVSEDARDTVRALAGTDAYVQARRRRHGSSVCSVT